MEVDDQVDDAVVSWVLRSPPVYCLLRAQSSRGGDTVGARTCKAPTRRCATGHATQVSCVCRQLAGCQTAASQIRCPIDQSQMQAGTAFIDRNFEARKNLLIAAMSDDGLVAGLATRFVAIYYTWARSRTVLVGRSRCADRGAPAASRRRAEVVCFLWVS